MNEPNFLNKLYDVASNLLEATVIWLLVVVRRRFKSWVGGLEDARQISKHNRDDIRTLVKALRGHGIPVPKLTDEREKDDD